MSAVRARAELASPSAAKLSELWSCELALLELEQIELEQGALELELEHCELEHCELARVLSSSHESSREL